MITSLVITSQLSHPIAVLGTADGHLLKVPMFEVISHNSLLSVTVDGFWHVPTNSRER